MTEADYVAACRAALAATGHTVAEQQLPNGVWVVTGCDRDRNPFAAGHPEGRGMSWRQACILNQVPPPVWERE